MRCSIVSIEYRNTGATIRHAREDQGIGSDTYLDTDGVVSRCHGTGSTNKIQQMKYPAVSFASDALAVARAVGGWTLWLPSAFINLLLLGTRMNMVDAACPNKQQ